MRVSLQVHWPHEVELIDRWERDEEGVVFPVHSKRLEWVALALQGDLAAVVRLRGILAPATEMPESWRGTDQEVIDEVGRRLVTGDLRLVRREAPENRSRPAPPPEPTPAPAPASGPAPKAKPDVVCENPECAPAFATAAASGAALVERSAPG